ncbi:ATP-binding protein [Dyadobacter sp. CY261]|uniref:hybrid sensor histidine kinase/response regulator n=1 Tax=Dyadobacter sp. CY261 TaxID=2907203 RepID=UPI001F3B2CB7|nr:hybrid sensor histidine kinase/response regulator [Dyadobacter sp. CY261]MCF0074416.1 ATP-binding protein [Dyadobacter sp. CY261]
MRVRTLVIYITIGFVAAVLALVTVQYMTRRNLEDLISANENLLDEYRMSSGLSHQADSTSRAVLARKMDVVDQSGQRVLRWNLYVNVLVFILLVAVFAIIVSRMKKQAELIGQLNTSEKKLKEAVLVKENFLANMSHEIRTPLNAILGYTNLLQKKKLDDDTRLHINTVQQSGETLLAIVNDILDLSKIESGMMRIERVPFDPEALVHSVATMFHHRSEEKHVPLIVTFDPALPEMITGDPTRLTQILVNLISNAFKFTEKGEVRLLIEAGQVHGGQVRISFGIIDTGIGIEAAKLETIFERFRQAQDSTTRQYGGTGLGLSIVRDLVQLQEGDIGIISEPGKGTSVKVTIPYRITPAGELPVKVMGTEASHHRHPGWKVLIAEDHPINQGLMTRLMEERGIESLIAGNGEEAVEILRSERFDLVFMDIQMPGMDGYQATRVIREELKLDVPIVAMTAHAMEGEKEKCIGVGMNDHIAKPVRESELDRVFREFAKPVTNGRRPANGHTAEGFKVIDLDYMREISDGDVMYEKLVTEQFLHLMPRELEALSSAAERHDTVEIRRIAHGIKTTISIMGLNALLDKHLDMLENEVAGVEAVVERVGKVLAICKEALGEAGILYRRFQDM